MITTFPLYDVSDDGLVRRDGRTLKPWRGISGHLTVNLRREGKTYRKYIHHLVLESFGFPRPDGMECRHLDDNPANNRLNNLKWGTRVENYRDSVHNGTVAVGSRHGRAKLTEEQVLKIRELIAEGKRPVDIGQMFGVSPQHISHIKSGYKKIWLHI